MRKLPDDAEPIYASSVRRWEKYGAKIQPLIDALGDLADV